MSKREKEEILLSNCQIFSKNEPKQKIAKVWMQIRKITHQAIIVNRSPRSDSWNSQKTDVKEDKKDTQAGGQMFGGC